MNILHLTAVINCIINPKIPFSTTKFLNGGACYCRTRYSCRLNLLWYAKAGGRKLYEVCAVKISFFNSVQGVSKVKRSLRVRDMRVFACAALRTHCSAKLGLFKHVCTYRLLTNILLEVINMLIIFYKSFSERDQLL